jgi:histidyl-tRNA synthetase
MGPVWRNEKPGPGRYRQFYQCDADTGGTASVAADAEICAMLADALETVGIPRGDYLIRVNNRKVLNGVMEVAGILDPADPESHAHERGIVLRAIDKLDRLGLEGLRALLGEGRKDESGDFTKGAGLAPEQVVTIMAFVEAPTMIRRELRDLAGSLSTIVDDEVVQSIELAGSTIVDLFGPPSALTNQIRSRAACAKLRSLVGASQQGLEGVKELEEIVELLEHQGIGSERVIVDPSVVRGLGYYTGPVFEAELTFEILDEKGRPRQFGSVAGGGRYDDLVKRFTGQAVPATGISIGVDRLLAALRAKGRIGGVVEGPVVVTVMDRERMADYQAMAAELRTAGIRAEVYLGNPKNFGNQLKYADKRGSPVAIIEGGDEKARGVVQVKDLILGARIAETATHEEWKDQPAQFECPRGDMVSEVRRILGRK